MQFKLQEPVLQAAQLAQVVLAAAVHQRVLVHPAHAGGVRPKARSSALGQLRGNLAEVLQHPRPRPVQVGAVLEYHVHVGITKKRIAAHVHRARHRQHGGGQRIGHLVFDHLRRLAGKRRFDDHLHIRQVRQGVDGGLAHPVEAPADQQRSDQQHQHPVADGPANQRSDHGLSPSMDVHASCMVIHAVVPGVIHASCME